MLRPLQITRNSIFCFCFLAFIVGCGSKVNPNAPASVKGKVTYQGAPLGGGTLVFHTGSAGAYTATINSDGSYQGNDFPVGDMSVTIDNEMLNPNRKVPEYKGGKGGAMGMYGSGAKGGSGPSYSGKAPTSSPVPEGANKGSASYVKLPAKYTDPKKTDLKVTLERGQQEKNFDLTD